MSEDATIEDEVEFEQPTTSSRPQTDSGLLKWSYIIEYAAKQWVLFLIFSIAVAVFLYLSAKQRRNEKKSRPSLKKRD